LTKEKDNLKSERDARDKRVAELQNTVEALKEEMNATVASAENKMQLTKQPLQERIDRLTSEIASLSNDYQTKLAAIEKQSQDKIEAINKDYQDKFVKQQQDSNANLAVQKNEMQERMAFLVSDLARAKEVSDKLASQLNEKDSLITSLNGEVSKLTANLNQKETEALALKNTISNLEVQVKSTTESVDGKVKSAEEPLKDRLNQLTSDLSAIDGNYKSKLAYSEKQWQDKLDTTTKEYEAKLAKQTEDANAALATERSQMQERTTFLVTDLAKSKDMVDKLSAQLRDKEATLASLNTSTSSNEEKVSSLQKTVDSLNKELASRDQEWQEKLDALKQEYEQKISAKEADLASQGVQEQSQMQERIALLEKELKDLGGITDSRIASFKTQLKDKDSVIAALSDEKNSVRSSASEKDSKIAELQSAVSGLQADLNTASSTVADKARLSEQALQEQIKQIGSERDALTTELNSLKRELPDKVTAIEQEWRSKMEGMTRQYEEKLAKQQESVDSGAIAEKNQMQERMSYLIKDLASAKDALNKASTQLQDRDSTISLLREEKTNLESGTSQKDKKITELQNAVYELDKKIKSSELLTATTPEPVDRIMQEKVANLEEEKTNLQNVIEFKNKKINELEKTGAAKEGPSDQALKEKIAQLTNELDAAKRDAETRIAASGKQWSAKLDELTRGYEEKLVSKYPMSEGEKNIVSKLSTQVKERNSSIEALTKEKTDLENSVNEKDKKIAELQYSILSLREELRTPKSSIGQKEALPGQGLEVKPDQVDAELAAVKKDADAKIALVNKQWQAKLESITKEYEAKLAQLKQRAGSMTEDDLLLAKIEMFKKPLQDKITELNNEIAALKTRESELSKKSEIGEKDLLAKDKEWQDKLSAVQEGFIAEENKWQEKATSELKGELDAVKKRDRAIEILKSEIAKRDQKIKDLEEVSSSLKKEAAPAQEMKEVSPAVEQPEVSSSVQGQKNVASEKEKWYDSDKELQEYRTRIKQLVLDNIIKSIDFAKYRGKVGSVRIEFELFSNGFLKEEPTFYGTDDETLMDSLYECFRKSLPFPEFPKSLKESSQRFTLVVSFGKK